MDKIRIVNTNGKTQGTRVETEDGVEIPHITGIDISFRLNDLVRAKLQTVASVDILAYPELAELADDKARELGYVPVPDCPAWFEGLLLRAIEANEEMPADALLDAWAKSHGGSFLDLVEQAAILIALAMNEAEAMEQSYDEVRATVRRAGK